MDDIMRCNGMEMLPSILRDERERLKQMPLYELVEELYRNLGLERLTGQEAYHYAFLDTVQQYLRDNPNDIHSFLEVWDAKLCQQAIPSGKQDGIRILTIHKSKGLEFHTVLLPFCDWAMESDKGDTLWCEAEKQEHVFNTLGRMPIAKTSTMGKSYYSDRYEEEHLQSRVDELNALYVALTRASCNMYILGNMQRQGCGWQHNSRQSIGGMPKPWWQLYQWNLAHTRWTTHYKREGRKVKRQPHESRLYPHTCTNDQLQGQTKLPPKQRSKGNARERR